MTALHYPMTLFGHGEPSVASGWAPERIELDPCCWVDHVPGFLTGADQLLADLEIHMEWFRGKRLMYGQWHQEPRRTSTEARSQSDEPFAIDDIRRELSQHYDMSFQGLFCNYYETGRDSVAWHADRIGRTEVDPLVAIISLGGPRTFRMRPQTGGPSWSISLESGDLLVMGGATQHHWEHAIPKVAHAAPRMSVTMRASRSGTTWLPSDELLGQIRDLD